MAKGGVRKAVAEAHVVLTNPTHFAVALRYERGQDEVPVVVAKGATVTMIVEAPGLQLTAVGRALGNAGVGDVVQVMNAQTRTTVEGVVEGPGRVRVTLRRPVTSTAQQAANVR